MSGIADVSSVFADTSLFLRFEENLGLTGLHALLDFFDAALRIVVDVERELKFRESMDFPDLAALKAKPLVGEYLRAPADQLSPQLTADVPLIAGMFPDASAGGTHKNWGEVATVLMASSQQAAVVIDDKAGRKFAKKRQLDAYTTREVAVAMTKSGALTDDDGYAVWNGVFPNFPRPRTDFDDAVAASP